MTEDPRASGDPGAGFQGRIGRTLTGSTPWWPPGKTPRAGAPDVVVVLLDDLGYSDFGCFGAEIRTPNIDALARRGLAFSNYTTVPMCTPARAALLTGKNPHAVGAGWLTFNSPGYPGYRAGEISRDAPTLAELLRESGYSTYAVGKWHNTADYNVTPAADRSSWPLQRGFDRFYGFLGGETHYFAPATLFSDNAMLERDTYGSSYYCTNDWTDTAIEWLRAHVSCAPDKPFFLYLAHNAPHAPLHARAEDLAPYRGAYDAGWDAIRAARIARQRQLGMHPRDFPLPGHTAGVPAWRDLDGEQRALYSRFMELYAAIVDNVDQNVGRLVEFLRGSGRLENTLFLITSDNGANGVGGIEGAVNNLSKRIARTEDPEMVRRVIAQDRLGGVETWPAYPLGWTDVSTAPFRLYKTTTMNGGIRVPLVVHWPRGVADAGQVRHQWVHVTDIVPTILEAVGEEYPARHGGFRTRALDGVSFRPALSSARAASARHRQHYELAGNRGFIMDGWKIVSLQPPGKPVDLDNWMLFNLDADPAEVHDLARANPDQLARLVDAFEADAHANYVYPLDNRDVRRALTVAPFLQASVDQARTFHPGDTVALAVVAPMVADRNYRLRCRFTWQPGQEGVIFALGDPIAGLALFIRGEALTFVFNGGQRPPVACENLPLRPGENDFELQHRALGQRRGTAGIALNGVDCATLDMSPTTILGLGVGEGLDIGIDRKLHVTPRYGTDGPFRFTGTIAALHIEPGAQAPDSYANRSELDSQRD